MLPHVLIDLLQDMRSQAQAAPSLAVRIELTRDIALFSLAFASMRRGHDLSVTMGSQVLRLPAGEGLIFNFQFGKTLRVSVDAIEWARASLVLPFVRCATLRHTSARQRELAGTCPRDTVPGKVGETYLRGFVVND